MKEIQHMSMPAEFTIGGVGKVENVAVNRLLTQLKKGLQRVTGRWEQRKRLLQQRMDELRAEREDGTEAGKEEGTGGEDG